MAERDGRADLGTNVHYGIEGFIKHGEIVHDPLDPFTVDELKRINLFVRWAEEAVDHFVDSERPVYSKKDKFCGTLDFTCVLEGQDGLWMGDIKNAKYIYPKNFLQTAAYQKAYTEETGRPFNGRIIVRLGDDNVEVIKRDHFKEDYAMFKAALRLNRWYNKIQKDIMKATRSHQ